MARVICYTKIVLKSNTTKVNYFYSLDIFVIRCLSPIISRNVYIMALLGYPMLL